MSRRPSLEERRAAARENTENLANANLQSNFGGSGGNRKFFLKSMKNDYPNLGYFSNHLVVNQREKFALVPFQVTNPDFPGFKDIKAVGDYREAINMHVAYHKGVGPNKSDVICRKAMYGEACPICEDLAEKAGTNYRDQNQYIKDGGTDQNGFLKLEFYKIKHKDVMCVWSYPREAIEVWTVPTWYFFEDFQKELNTTKADSTAPNFILGDPEFGPDITVTPDEPMGKKSLRPADAEINPNTMYPGKMRKIDLTPRTTPLTDEILDMAIPLDQYLNVLSYDEIRAEFYGIPMEDEDDEYVEKPVVTATSVDSTVKASATVSEDEPVVVEDEAPKERNRRERGTGFTCPYKHDPTKDWNNMKSCNECTDDEYDACERVFKANN